LLTPTPTLHGLYLALGMMHACESVCACVFICYARGWVGLRHTVSCDA